MDSQKRRLPSIRFRVLIIGRANAGKTSILQRVCDTTESPKIYRINGGDRQEVKLNPTIERGEHNIEDELIFTNHDGYVFHDSRGFEAGREDELKIVQDFVRQRSTAKRLRDRLHAIWYCIPMDDTSRPVLNMKHFDLVCPDKNVPVIAVFTKYDDFKRKVFIALRKEGGNLSSEDVDNEATKRFEGGYLGKLEPRPKYVRLEKMHKPDGCCDALIVETASALNNDMIAVMLLAVQRGNLETNVRAAVKRISPRLSQSDATGPKVVRWCILHFPAIWFWFGEFDLDLNLNDVLNVDLDRFDLDVLDLNSQAQQIQSLLLSYMGMTPFLISDSSTHHIMIVALLILEHSSLLIASSQNGNITAILNQAYSKCTDTSTFSTVQEQFSASPMEYNSDIYATFILNHRFH